MSSGSGGMLVTLGAVLLLAMAVIAVLSFRLGQNGDPASEEASPTPPASSTTVAPVPVPEIYQQVAPSVVVITTSNGSLGTGVVVTDAGTVLTADHVISGGGDITVVFYDGTTVAASVASRDPTIDVAVLTPQGLPEVVVPALLGGAVAVGAEVVAIGNPLGLQDSTSTGVVSGLDRRHTTDAGEISGLIQFDAAVNPGSSGGPLLSDQGTVIGIVVSIADPGGDDAFAGIGFAVPIGAALGGGFDGSGNGPQL